MDLNPMSAPATPRTDDPVAGDIAAMAFVQAASLCQGLDENQLGTLYKGGRVVGFAMGDLIFAEGAADDALYIVFDGGVSIRKHHGDGVVELASLDRQGVFGETGVLTQQPRNASVVARVDTRLVRLDGQTVRAVADEAPKLGRKLAALMAARTKDTEKKLGG